MSSQRNRVFIRKRRDTEKAFPGPSVSAYGGMSLSKFGADKDEPEIDSGIGGLLGGLKGNRLTPLRDFFGFGNKGEFGFRVLLIFVPVIFLGLAPTMKNGGDTSWTMSLVPLAILWASMGTGFSIVMFRACNSKAKCCGRGPICFRTLASLFFFLFSNSLVCLGIFLDLSSESSKSTIIDIYSTLVGFVSAVFVGAIIAIALILLGTGCYEKKKCTCAGLIDLDGFLFSDPTNVFFVFVLPSILTLLGFIALPILHYLKVPFFEANYFHSLMQPLLILIGSAFLYSSFYGCSKKCRDEEKDDSCVPCNLVMFFLFLMFIPVFLAFYFEGAFSLAEFNVITFFFYGCCFCGLVTLILLPCSYTHCCQKGKGTN